MEITVILPSFLGEYHGAALNRESKFERAVTSFLHQDYPLKKLIIVSDGCETTNRIVRDKFPHDCVKLLTIPKQPLFSGAVREMGLRFSTSKLITYLDGDDTYSQHSHLSTIVDSFKSNPDIDWVYFDDIVQWNPYVQSIREAKLELGGIGTSNIAHKNHPDLSWGDKDGYGHDHSFIKQMMDKYPNKIKIYGTSYKVCHIPNSVDF